MQEPTNMDLLKGFEVFAQVAETRSMTAAARALGLTQSAVSQAMRSLEAHFDTRLVDRDRRPLNLTPAGLALRFHAMRMLRQAELARAEVRQADGGPLHHLRLAVLSTLAGTLVPPLLAARASGRIGARSLTVLRGLTSDHRQALLNREVDLVISSNALQDNEGLERHALLTERLILALPADVPGGGDLGELAARLPLLRYVGRTQIGWTTEQHLRRLRLEIPHGLAFESSADLLAAIGAGAGWGIVAPSHAAAALEDQARVRLLPLPGPRLVRAITMIGRAQELGAVPAAVAAIFRDALHATALPRLGRLIPWLGDHVAVPAGEG